MLQCMSPQWEGSQRDGTPGTTAFAVGGGLLGDDADEAAEWEETVRGGGRGR